MATAEGLMGVGVPAEQAKRCGVSIVSVTTTASPTQLKGPGNLAVLVTVGGASQDVLLPNNADLGDEVTIYTLTASALDILPQSGGTINNGAPDAAISITGAATTVNSGIRFRKMTALNWRTMGSFA